MKVKALKSWISQNFTEMGQFHDQIHGKCHGCEIVNYVTYWDHSLAELDTA